MTVLLGMSALVLDVGSWFRAQRAAQAAADAAALAGAQSLPDDPGTAQTRAVQYADQNGGGLAPADAQIRDGALPNDTLAVHVERSVPGFFSHFTSVQVGANAAARGFKPGEAKWVAPIVVNIQHPALCGGLSATDCKDGDTTAAGCPCYGPGYPTSLPLDKTGAPGAFDMLNLIPIDEQTNGTVGASTLASWIESGFDDYLALNDYYSDPGAKFNDSKIQAALSDRMHTVMLFPVFDRLTGSGSNARYHIVSWVGFYLTGYSISGQGSLSGYFTKTIWDGIETTTGDNAPDFGARSVALIQ
jgi:hypothetical protein